MVRSTSFLAGSIATVLLASTALTAAAAGWRLTDLGVDGVNSGAYSINNHGEVVGWQANPATGATEGFFFTGGQKQVLPSLGGTVTVPYDVNNHGVVVGWSSTVADTGYRAFAYRNGVMSNLGSAGWDQSFAYGINDAGQVAGLVSRTTEQNVQVFLYSGGQFTFPAGFAGKQIRSVRLNAKGQIAAQVETFVKDGYLTKAFVFDGNTTYTPGRFGGDWSFVAGLDDAGILAGYAGRYGFGPIHMGLYDINTRTPLGIMEGDTFEYLNGMNNKGQLIGYITDSTGLSTRPYIFDTRTRTKTFVGELNLPGFAAWRILYLYDINDRGQVVGIAQDRATRRATRAFILSPIPD